MNYNALVKYESIINGKKNIILGIGVISSLVLYYIYSNKNRKKIETDGEDDVIKGRSTVIELKVPSDCVRSLIGPQGQNIKEIQRKTNTRINFKDRNEQNKNISENNNENGEQQRIILIRGSSTNVHMAEFEIKKFILDSPSSITQDFYVPQYACGRIIGRGGSSIREICNSSNCKVSLIDENPTNDFEKSKSIEKLSDNSADLNEQSYRIVRIIGPYERISFAKQLILNKIKEEEMFRERKSNKYRS